MLTTMNVIYAILILGSYGWSSTPLPPSHPICANIWSLFCLNHTSCKQYTKSQISIIHILLTICSNEKFVHKVLSIMHTIILSFKNYKNHLKRK